MDLAAPVTAEQGLLLLWSQLISALLDTTSPALGLSQAGWSWSHSVIRVWFLAGLGDQEGTGTAVGITDQGITDWFGLERTLQAIPRGAGDSRQWQMAKASSGE